MPVSLLAPIVGLVTQRMVGCEALSRWHTASGRAMRARGIHRQHRERLRSGRRPDKPGFSAMMFVNKL
jgi:hypothetical protein